MKVPLRVREVAEAKGFTATSLKDATGLAYGTVLAYWNADLRQVNWRVLCTIAKALEVAEPKDLIRDKEECE